MQITHEKREITIAFDDFSLVFTAYENMDLHNAFKELSRCVEKREECYMDLCPNQTIILENVDLDTNSYRYVLRFTVKTISNVMDSKFEYTVDVDDIGMDVLSKKFLYLHDIMREFEPNLKKQDSGSNFLFNVFG